MSNTTITPHTEEWLNGPRKTSFYTRLYSPPNAKAALVFAHGFIEHVGRYEHVFPQYAEKGISVLAFDQRGFGRTALDGKRSAGSSYGKTSAADQRADLRWALDEAAKRWPSVPLFLMGHSMGGGLVLSYCTLEQPTNLRGVIATSPLINQAKPAAKALRKVGQVLSHVAPNASFPASVKAEDLSRDPEVGKKYLKDPLVVHHGTLKGINDMLEAGDHLTTTGAKRWPKSLPLLLVHGSADKVTSHEATKRFHDSITADDKTFSSFEGGYHELQNEPNGMSEKLVKECIAWIEQHLPASEPAAAPISTTEGSHPAAKL